MATIKPHLHIGGGIGNIERTLEGGLRRVAPTLAPLAARVERRFERKLKELRLAPKARRAVCAITLGAAARTLEAGKPLADFLEQVEYNGRRLAKLEVSPELLDVALEAYAQLLDPAAPDHVFAFDLLQVRGQLELAVKLKLNHAFYQVREAESQAFYELFQAELQVQDQPRLLGRFAGILKTYCGAEAARIRLAADLPRGLLKPQYVEPGPKADALLVDAGWRGRFGSYWSVPVLSGRSLAGVIQFGFLKPYQWLPRELRVLRVAADRCLEAVRKSRLIQDLAEGERQIHQLAEEMLHIEEAERRRISRELHDESGQLLMCLRLRLEMLEASTPANLPELCAGLAEARGLVDRTIVEIRRLLSDLSPAVLEQLGLAAAVRQLAKRLQELRRMDVRLAIGTLAGVPAHHENIAYRLMQEACNNVARHSSATNVKLSLGVADSELRVLIEDDGIGFDSAESGSKPGSCGLAGMKERVALAGGAIQIQSRPGCGTKVDIRLPLEDTVSTRAAEPAMAVSTTPAR